MLASDLPIAVIGATGAVGREVLSILAHRGHEATAITALSSARSAGTRIPFGASYVTTAPLSAAALTGVRLALLATPSGVSRTFTPELLDAGVAVIDNSSAFRHEPDVPLIVPEVNAADLDSLDSARVVVANPNCSTILLLVALEPLRARFGVSRIDVSTYQAVSGAGAAGMDELVSQTRQRLGDRPVTPKVFHEPCAFNVFSHNSAVDEDSGVNGEEQKMIRETRRIWRNDRVEVCPTCVRVPTMRAHAEAVTVTLSTPVSERQVRDALADGTGVRIVDDRRSNTFPTALNASGGDDVLVGRIRPDPSDPGSTGPGGERTFHRFCLFLAGDQIRKGAALNAIQIADLLAERGLLAHYRTGRAAAGTRDAVAGTLGA